MKYPSTIQAMVLALLGITFSGCSSEPLCTDEDPVRTGTVSNVRLQLLRVDRAVELAGRPVVIQDRSGATIEEGVTDADGVYVVASMPADATLTVAVPIDEREADIRLVTYAGLESDETLALRLRPRPRLQPVGSREPLAMVSVSFNQLDDPRVDEYSISLGANCGDSGRFAHDPSQPGKRHTVTVDAYCLGAGDAVITAMDEERRFLGTAGSPLDLQANDVAVVELPPWETGTNELLLTGSFPEIGLAMVTGLRNGVVVSEQRFDGVTGTIPFPDAPNTFDALQITLEGTTIGRVEIMRSTFDSFELDYSELPPALGGFDAVDLQSGAPRLSWRFSGEPTAVIGYFKSLDIQRGPTFERYMIRTGDACQIQFPPLPAQYAHQVPRLERRLFTSVKLVVSPALDHETARQQMGPLYHPVPDMVLFSTGDGVVDTNVTFD